MSATDADTPKAPRPSRAERSAAARLYAVQALFQMEAMGQSAERVQREFETWRIDVLDNDVPSPEADLDLFAQILDHAVTWQGKIDGLTDRALVERWPIDRIDPVLRAIFRAAGAEMIRGNAPARVIVSQYVQLVQAFFPEGRESNFVNAVLDHMARENNPAAFG